MARPVVITGVKKLDRALAKLEPKLQKKLTRKATRKAAKEIVLPIALSLVPEKTGALKRSLSVRAVTRRRGRIGHMVANRNGMFTGDQFYGGFAEFGTKTRRTRKGHERGAMPEFGYLRRPLYDNATRIEKVFQQAMREFLSEAK